MIHLEELYRKPRYQHIARWLRKRSFRQSINKDYQLSRVWEVLWEIEILWIKLRVILIRMTLDPLALTIKLIKFSNKIGHISLGQTIKNKDKHLQDRYALCWIKLNSLNHNYRKFKKLRKASSKQQINEIHQPKKNYIKFISTKRS